MFCAALDSGVARAQEAATGRPVSKALPAAQSVRETAPTGPLCFAHAPCDGGFRSLSFPSLNTLSREQLMRISLAVRATREREVALSLDRGTAAERRPDAR